MLHRKRYCNICIALLVMFIIAPYNVALSDTQQEKILLPDYLNQIGNKLDCYFTLEWSGKSLYSYSTITIPNDISISDVKSLMQKLYADLGDTQLATFSISLQRL